MRIDEIQRLVIHELRSLGIGQQSDRRGTICELVLADIPNTEHAVNVAVRVLQRVCSMLDEGYFWSENRDKGPTEFTEQFEAWIAGEPAAKAVRIRHKYWSQERVDGFLEIMVTLARLHRWEVEDLRAENDPVEEMEEFATAVEAAAKSAATALGADAGDTDSLVADYLDRAAAENTCPWRLLVKDVIIPKVETRPGFGQEIPGTEQIEPGIYVAKNVKSINTGKVIPFKKE